MKKGSRREREKGSRVVPVPASQGQGTQMAQGAPRLAHGLHTGPKEAPQLFPHVSQPQSHSAVFTPWFKQHLFSASSSRAGGGGGSLSLFI